MKIRFQSMARPKRIHLFRTWKDAYYYGSDLNKYYHLKCTDKMDVINIDCLTYKAGQSADGPYAMRFIEYKHIGERLTKRQDVIYSMIARNYRNNGPRGIKKKFPVNFYVIYANPPEFDCVKIVDMRTRKSIIIDDANIFILWSQFELSFKDIHDETKRYKKIQKAIKLSQERAKGSGPFVSITWREWTKAIKAS